MKYLLFILLISLPMFQACTGNHSHGKTDAVQLDNGKRWKANPETTSGISAMQAILTKYEGQTTDAASRNAMKTELDAAFQAIFEQCTMTGPAHDQLHNYLLPMKDMLKKCGSDDAGESDQAINQLKKHLADYQTYFE